MRILKRPSGSVLFCLAALLGWSLIAPFLAKSLVVKRPLSNADVIYVLAGSRDYEIRTLEAASQYKAGIAPAIYLTDDGVRSGWDNDEKRNPLFWERAVRSLIRNDVPRDVIHLQPVVPNSTRDEADNMVALAIQKGIHSILLVTSDYHSRRALSAFETAATRSNADIEFGIVSPAPYNVEYSVWIWWLQPSGWQTVGAELLKSIVYFVDDRP